MVTEHVHPGLIFLSIGFCFGIGVYLLLHYQAKRTVIESSKNIVSICKQYFLGVGLGLLGNLIPVFIFYFLATLLRCEVDDIACGLVAGYPMLFAFPICQTVILVYIFMLSISGYADRAAGLLTPYAVGFSLFGILILSSN